MEKQKDFNSDIREQDRIEREIFEKIKDKIKNTYSKESKDIIRAEIKNRNYNNYP